jgi:hypothetical protein
MTEKTFQIADLRKIAKRLQEVRIGLLAFRPGADLVEISHFHEKQRRLFGSVTGPSGTNWLKNE